MLSLEPCHLPGNYEEFNCLAIAISQNHFSKKKTVSFQYISMPIRFLMAMLDIFATYTPIGR